MIKLKWMLVFCTSCVLTVIWAWLAPSDSLIRFSAMLPASIGFLLFVFSVMPSTNDNKQDTQCQKR